MDRRSAPDRAVIKFLFGCVVGALGGLAFLVALFDRPTSTASDPVYFWGTSRDDSGQWTYTGSPLT